MKLKITPLFIASIGVIIFGFFYVFYRIDTTLGPLAGMLLMFLGVLCLGVYFILRIVFRTLLWLQLLAEIVLIIIVAFSSYKLSGKVLLHVPANFKGNILLIYGVDKKPKLKPSSFFNRNIDVVVPPSGIIFISNKFAEKYFNNLLIIDSLHSRAFEPGYNVPYAIDTLKCSSKHYSYESLYYLYPQPPDVKIQADTIERNLKAQEACKMLGE